MNTIFKSLLLICFAWLFAPESANAQIKSDLVNFPSPNAASLGMYGEIPVNQFTGIPNIQIPLYAVTDRDVQIPISLNYHTASVKLNGHPGWTGLGWTLIAGGAITRVVNGAPDEINSGTRPGFGYYFNHEKVNVSDWSTVVQLKEYGHDLLFGEPYNYEVMPDEFHFNFLDYSGKFFLDHNGNWVVQSERDIKILFEPENDGFISTADLRDPLPTKLYSTNIPQHNDTYFNKFTLVADDGTRYEFGGADATEYSVPYRNPQDKWLIPTTWNLTKVTSPRGTVVSFEYEPGNTVCALSNGYSYFKYHKEGGSSWFSLNPSCSGESSNFGRQPANGFLIFPVYLKRILARNVTLEFERSITTEMGYINYDLYRDVASEEPEFYGYGYYFDDPSDLKWEQLDAINISSSDGNLFKKFKLNYTDSELTRLKLLSVEEFDAFNAKNAVYSLKYNTNEMSWYCSDQLDHWGFFNGYDVSQFNPQTVQEWLDQYYSTREPDLTGNFYKYEILEKIIYPTGGYTTFEYEPHSYNLVVDKERDDFSPDQSRRTAGGLRINKISSYAKVGAAPSEKEYYYVKGYSGQDPSTLPSSGILSGQSQYYWPGYSGKDLDNNTFTYDLFSSSSLLPNAFNAFGSHIGYSEVIERTPGNGYTKYTFTNYEPDIHGVPHMDDVAIAWIDADRSIYSPFSSKAIERGKLTSLEVYNSTGQKAQETIYHYAPSSVNFVRGLFIEHFNICSGVTASAQTWFGTAYKHYVNNFNKEREITRIYDQVNQSISFSNVSDYTYKNGKHVTKIETENSNSGKLVVKRKYPADYASTAASFIPNMLAKNMVGVVLEEQLWNKTAAGTYTLVSGRLSEFGDVAGTGLTLPILSYSLEALNPVSESSFGETFVSEGPYTSFNSTNNYYKESGSIAYDAHGNIKEVTSRDGITTAYIWGYNSSLPVAQLSNALFAEVEQVLGSGFDLGAQGLTSIQENQLRSASVLDKALITTYTYNPLVGIRSKTDPDGNTTNYDYDEFGRLKLIKDFQDNIMKRFSYQYKVENVTP